MSEYETKMMFGERYVKIDKATWTVIGKDKSAEQAFIAFHKRHNRPYEGMNAIQRSNAEKKEKAARKLENGIPEPEIPFNVEQAINSDEYEIIQSYLNSDV